MTKKLILIGGILMLLTAFCGAQVGTNKKDRGLPGIKTVAGKVGEISPGKIVIENEHGAKREIPLDEKTKYQLGKNKTAKLDDVKAGSMVKVSYRESDRTATLIAVDLKK